MKTSDTTAAELNDLLVTQGFDPEIKDYRGQDEENPEDGKILSFDYTINDHNYGTMVLLLDTQGNLEIFSALGITNRPQASDQEDWDKFLYLLRHFARSHMKRLKSPQPMHRLKHRMRSLSSLKESYYGTKKVSYAGAPKEARLMIRHNRDLEESDARFRYVESLFIETTDGQRFKLASKKLSVGRAMLEHVRQGGTPYDAMGQHINEMANELNVLSRFLRVNKESLSEQAGAMRESAYDHYQNLRKNIKSLSTANGYKRYTESWEPTAITEGEDLVEEIKNLFVEQHIDPRIEDALPILANIKKKEAAMKMQEVKEFENWVNSVVEAENTGGGMTSNEGPMSMEETALSDPMDDRYARIEWLMKTHGLNRQEATETCDYDTDPETWKDSRWEDEYADGDLEEGWGKALGAAALAGTVGLGAMMGGSAPANKYDADAGAAYGAGGVGGSNFSQQYRATSAVKAKADAFAKANPQFKSEYYGVMNQIDSEYKNNPQLAMQKQAEVAKQLLAKYQANESLGEGEGNEQQLEGDALLDYLMKHFGMSREQAIAHLKEKGMMEGGEPCNECGLYESDCTCGSDMGAISELARLAGTGSNVSESKAKSKKTMIAESDELNSLKRLLNY